MGDPSNQDIIKTDEGVLNSEVSSFEELLYTKVGIWNRQKCLVYRGVLNTGLS